MKRISIFVLSVFLSVPFFTLGDNAPITIISSITNVTGAPTAVTVPVKVKNFMDIGYIKLTIKYQTARLTYVSAAANTSFPGMTVSNTVVSGTGTILVSWTGTSGITLADLSHLVNITFTYISGTGIVKFSPSFGDCLYKKYDGGAFTPLTSQPFSSFFINGGAAGRGAPITYAPVIPNATPGAYGIPVTVYNFSDVGAISLTLDYNSAVIAYQNSFTQNPAISGAISVTDNVLSGTIHRITMGWYGSSSSLPDGSTMLTLNFLFSTTNGGYSTLNWYENTENGPDCEYNDGSGIAYMDSPSSYYYRSGIIYSSSNFSPKAALPNITNASPAGTVLIPVTVNDFSSCGSFTLSFEYDPAVMSYNSFTPNPSLGGSMVVTDNPPGTNGKRKLAISWTGTPLSLSNGSTLVTLNFTYSSGTTSLNWVTDATSCRFNDANGNAMYDLPKSFYYSNGLVTSHGAPKTIAWYATPSIGQQATVPAKVKNFTNIGYFSLTLFYDPGVLTYQSASLVPALGGSFTSTLSEPGRLLFTWTGSAASLADSSNLINMVFTYNGGMSRLTWYDTDTISYSHYAETSSSAKLYDIPYSSYYVSGYIGPLLVADFSATSLNPLLNTTVTFNDLTTGEPISWAWSISPSGGFSFLFSSGAGVQNPMGQFTVDGVYDVTLVASNGTMTSTKTKTAYIIVGTPGVWTGITSSDWSTGSNWNNFQVPLNTVNVIIPSSGVTNWPLFTGDFTLGTQCNNISLNGASQFTVTGNFAINPTHSLTFTGSGAMKVGGNWSNSGSFITGTGSVEFYGPNPSSILAPTNETFFNIIENKTGTALNITNTITVNGDLTIK